jgi:hypothetical protein
VALRENAANDVKYRLVLHIFAGTLSLN